MTGVTLQSTLFHVRNPYLRPFSTISFRSLPENSIFLYDQRLFSSSRQIQKFVEDEETNNTAWLYKAVRSFVNTDNIAVYRNSALPTNEIYENQFNN